MEIERKWMVNGWPEGENFPALPLKEEFAMRQGYISVRPTVRIREEALKGGEGINTPHIDSQQEVYTAMLEELELANSLYNASLGLDDPTKDGIYGGDIAKWQKFTNTLRLRLLMRVSGRNTVSYTHLRAHET